MHLDALSGSCQIQCDCREVIISCIYGTLMIQNLICLRQINFKINNRCDFGQKINQFNKN